MNPVQYSLISDRIENAPFFRQAITYGIVARSADGWAAIRDISTQRLWVEKLIGRLTRLQVSLCHFREAVEDALNS